MKGKALRRALQTSDANRLSVDVPLITDSTELITPAKAQELLRRNKSNRPVNWKKVEEYSDMMARGEWQIHGQGILLDTAGNLLTGQNRLWAVVYSDVSVYIRISRGNPPSAARVLDRGRPQSARDLAARGTGRKHSPVESSIARAMLALTGHLRPSHDTLAGQIERNAVLVPTLLAATAGTKKSRAVLMVLAAICAESTEAEQARVLARRIERLADALENALKPQSASRCWGRGAAYALAMENARRIVQAELRVSG